MGACNGRPCVVTVNGAGYVPGSGYVAAHPGCAPCAPLPPCVPCVPCSPCYPAGHPQGCAPGASCLPCIPCGLNPCVPCLCGPMAPCIIPCPPANGPCCIPVRTMRKLSWQIFLIKVAHIFSTKHSYFYLSPSLQPAAYNGQPQYINGQTPYVPSQAPTFRPLINISDRPNLV